MGAAVDRGLAQEGVLPGGLGCITSGLGHPSQDDRLPAVHRTASSCCMPTRWPSPRRTPPAGVVVTAPTCGSSGVLPAVLRYVAGDHGMPRQRRCCAPWPLPA